MSGLQVIPEHFLAQLFHMFRKLYQNGIQSCLITCRTLTQGLSAYSLIPANTIIVDSMTTDKFKAWLVTLDLDQSI